MTRDSEDAGDTTGGEVERFAARFTRPVLITGPEAIQKFVSNAAPMPGWPSAPAPVPPLPSPPPQPPADPGRSPASPRPIPQPLPRPGPRPSPRDRCPEIKAAADASLVTRMNHWWQNWAKTHAYIAGTMCFPTNVDELAAAVRLAEASSLPVRAIGGGWSFSDTSLPGTITTTRPDVTTANQLAAFLPLAGGFAATSAAPPSVDLTIPSVAVVDPTDGTLMGYDSHNRAFPGIAVPAALSLQMTLTGTQPKPVCLINTRSLKSSLQATFSEILSPEAKQRARHYFHVEGGITIEEIGPLLDAQSPRLALEASGGNPGATLAGSISTGTHGAEQSTPLLVDRVKAIHLVGPGGLQWWIEGDEPIVDVEALLLRYPCLDRTRVVTGRDRIDGATPQDWLNSLIVSMGCVGVIYSVVIEVTELTGVREVVSQTTWWNLLSVTRNLPIPIFNGTPVFPVLQQFGLASENQLRIRSLNPGLSAAIVNMITSGSFSGRIAPGANVYSDLAFNPNRRRDGDLDCWIVNRDSVPVPFDRQPPSTGGMGDVVDAVFSAMADAFGGDVAGLVNRMGRVYGFIDPVLGVFQQFFNPLAPLLNGILQALVPGTGGLILGNLISSANPFPLFNMVTRIAKASDPLDVALEAITKPMADSQSSDLAQPFLTGFLASTLGTAKSNPGIALGTSVGAIGFPKDGLVGAGLEVAMPASSAFNFIQTEILDRMIPQNPFFGYISIRVCPPTNTLLGMPQWNPSVMIEVVSFGDAWGRIFMTTLQTRIVSQILSGTLDAMLHWGLENDQLTGQALRTIPAMKRPTPGLAEDEANPGVQLDRVAAFKMIRDQIRSANGSNPSTLFRAFDNAFTTRLGL